MTNIEAARQLVNGLMCSDVWDKLSTADKVAIRKAITALQNIYYGYGLHEIDSGMPITYVTKGEVKVIKDIDDNAIVKVDNRPVFRVFNHEEGCRGHRCEIAIYDNTIDKKCVDEVISPMLKYNTMLIHDAFDIDEISQIDKEWKEKVKKELNCKKR